MMAAVTVTVTVTAAVLAAFDGVFTLETLPLGEPAAGEIRVRIAGTGICHTDLKVARGYNQVPLPVVLGHEGAGVVDAVGRDVETLAPGDHVVLSFAACGRCPACAGHHPAYCDAAAALSFGCEKVLAEKAGRGIHGGFFGQSSFASHAIVAARNAVKVDRDLPLANLGPLGCGFQTGAGIILNVLQPAPGTSLAVFGSGNVGLSAIMAAVIAGMDPVIAVDINPDRLAMAKTLGATHTLLSTEAGDPVAAIAAMTANRGVNFAVDTTNRPPVVRQAFESLANRGTCVHSGGGGHDLVFPGSHLLHGRTVTGVIQGDSDPQIFIPVLLEYHRQGRFPFDRLLAFYPLDGINRAVADMQSGTAIKPVILPGN